MTSATRADIERMAEEWLHQNGKESSGVQTILLPVGFVSTLAEFMEPGCERRPGNWHTARTFPAPTRAEGKEEES